MIPAKKANSVFLNCPFDKSYKNIFDAVIFAIFDCGFVPRCSLETSDSTQSRLAKIIGLIEGCDYAIHDISYTELSPETHLPRFNMPFELGLFFGCQNYGGQLHRKKTSLILDRDPFRYHSFLSDISGQDIRPHSGDPRAAVREVRDWLRSKSGKRNIPGGAEIWIRYEAFRIELPNLCAKEHVLLDELTFPDFANFVASWLERTRGRERQARTTRSARSKRSS